MRLIDADKLALHCHIVRTWYSQIVLHLLDDQPTVDAVPVVMCKDCKHSYVDTTPYGDIRRCGEVLYNFLRENICVKDDFFCACGERICDDTY